MTKKVCHGKMCSCKLNSMAKCHCQICVTKASELSNIRICAVCERKLVAKFSVTNNLRQRKTVRGNLALLCVAMQ